MGIMNERLFRDAAPIETDAAKLGLFDTCHAFPKLCRVHCRFISPRPRPDHHHIENLISHPNLHTQCRIRAQAQPRAIAVKLDEELYAKREEVQTNWSDCVHARFHFAVSPRAARRRAEVSPAERTLWMYVPV